MLDAFGYDTVAELVRKAYDVTGYCFFVGECHQFIDEKLVDLQTVDIELPFPGEGGIPGTEVIDCNLDAHALQLSNNLVDVLIVGSKHRLGDLQADAAGIDLH